MFKINKCNVQFPTACRQKLCLKKEIITAISGLPHVITKTMNK